MIQTTVGVTLPNRLGANYFKRLVNAFFKILPIKEDGEESLPTYIRSLQSEILGCEKLITELNNNANILTLVSILQYLYDNPDCSVQDVKREVFRAISICNQLKSEYEKVNQK